MAGLQGVCWRPGPENPDSGHPVVKGESEG